MNFEFIQYSLMLILMFVIIFLVLIHMLYKYHAMRATSCCNYTVSGLFVSDILSESAKLEIFVLGIGVILNHLGSVDYFTILNNRSMEIVAYVFIVCCFFLSAIDRIADVFLANNLIVSLLMLTLVCCVGVPWIDMYLTVYVTSVIYLILIFDYFYFLIKELKIKFVGFA